MEDPAVALEQLRGQVNRKLADLEGQIKNLQTAVQMGMQAIREQFTGLVAALGHKDVDCESCRKGIERQMGDHETRLRILEAAKWKLVGALLLAGPVLGGIFGAAVTWLLNKVAQ